MELELRLDPDDANRLLRHPVLASAVRGRPQAHRIVWHDSPDAALCQHGIALARERAVWRLEKLVPSPDDHWPPGTPPPLLAEGSDLAALGDDLPAPLAPVVAFSGRRQVLTIAGEPAAATLTLLRGVLRTVTAEHAASRVQLAGEEATVLQLGLALAELAPAEIACTTLAGEALAVAHAAVPAMRRAGTPVLPDRGSLAISFAHVLAHLTEVVLQHAPAAAADRDGPEPVHQMRVALRRLRSAVSVFRHALDCPELRAAQEGLKALSLRLGPTRDWDVFLGETLAVVREAFPHEKRLARLLAAAQRRRNACHAALRDFLRSAAFRQLGVELAWLAAATAWHPPVPEEMPAPDLADFAARVLGRRLRKLATDTDLRELDPAALHELRLKAKRTRYAAEFFAPLYGGKAPRRFIERLSAVQDGLGVLNDRTTAERLLAELGGPGGGHGYAVGLVLGYAAAGSAGLLPRVVRRWEKFRATDAFWD